MLLQPCLGELKQQAIRFCHAHVAFQAMESRGEGGQQGELLSTNEGWSSQLPVLPNQAGRCTVGIEGNLLWYGAPNQARLIIKPHTARRTSVRHERSCAASACIYCIIAFDISMLGVLFFRVAGAAVMHNAAGDLHMPNSNSSPVSRLIQRQNSLIKEVGQHLALALNHIRCSELQECPWGCLTDCGPF